MVQAVRPRLATDHGGVYAEKPTSGSSGGYYRDATALQDTCDLRKEIPPLYWRATLADLPEALVRAYRELPESKGLYLWGQPGRGKTHAMAGFARDLWARGFDVKRVTYETLMLAIRDAFKPGSKMSEMDIIKSYIETDVLLLEDVGTTTAGRESDFSMRTFFVLLDARLEQMRATYVTSNRTIGQLGDGFNSRIESRLHAACMPICLTGEDWRTRQ